MSSISVAGLGASATPSADRSVCPACGGSGSNDVDAHPSRIKYLDGLRGLAVLAVIGWHYYGTTYADILPYGDRYHMLPVFGQGWLGVYLFFLISGFVIFRTLETSTSLLRFLVRRWIRLAPAILLCSLLLSSATLMLPAMPSGGYRLVDIAAALTFVSPSFYHALLDVDVNLVDGAYWTLVTEFSFYVVFGSLFFAVGWQRAVSALIGLWIIADALRFVPAPILGRAAEPLWWMGMEYFGWFASGAIFYKARSAGSARLYWLATGIAVACSLTNFQITPWGDKAALLGVTALFAGCHRSVALQRMLSVSWLFFVGTISYPLYLLHNHLGLGLIVRLGADAGGLAPVVVAGGLMPVAYAIHVGYESKVAPWLTRWLLVSRTSVSVAPMRRWPAIRR